MTDIDSSLSAADAAAAWYARLNGSAVTPADRAAFSEWRTRSLETERAWHTIELATSRLDANRDDQAFRILRAEALSQPARPRRQALSALAAAALLTLSGAGAFVAWQQLHRGAAVPAIKFTEYHTKIGERATVRLADGSTMLLNTDTLVRVAHRADTRAVELLRGEAYFTVAKDHVHPFVVGSGGRNVTAVGTEFSVRSLPNDYQVALVQGRVRVDLPAVHRSEMLNRGETLSQTGANIRRTKDGAPSVAEWTTGQVRFDAAPLAEVVAEMNRYSARKLVLGDSALGRHLFSGTLQTDNVAALIEALTAYRIARVSAADHERIVLGRY